MRQLTRPINPRKDLIIDPFPSPINSETLENDLTFILWDDKQKLIRNLIRVSFCNLEWQNSDNVRIGSKLEGSGTIP